MHVVQALLALALGWAAFSFVQWKVLKHCAPKAADVPRTPPPEVPPAPLDYLAITRRALEVADERLRFARDYGLNSALAILRVKRDQAYANFRRAQLEARS